MPTNVDKAIVNIDRRILAINTNINNLLRCDLDPTSEDLQTLEKMLGTMHSNLAALQTARKLQASVGSETDSENTRRFIGGLQGKFRLVSWRPHIITFLGGLRITIYMPYYARKCASTKGITPHLCMLGIIQSLTPALASLAAMMSSALSSFVEAEKVLNELGTKLDDKTIRLVSKSFAVRARAGQKAAKLITDDTPKLKSENRLNRILISTDGGRIRIRRKKRGPKGKGGRDRYHAEWREPKLIIIVLVDEKGRQCKSFPPVIDATMGGPDAAFSLLEKYLKLLSIEKAKLSFVSDGAKWIWQRVEKLFNRLKIKLSEVTLILDYYHAVQHLNQMAALKMAWDSAEKKRWIQKMKKWLLKGKIDDVIQSMTQMTKGTHSNDLRRELRYFISHTSRLGYKDAREAGLSIGSGAVESAIRRVVNLRLKGPGIIWSEEGAEEMLMLRCFFKAGRWVQLEKWAFSTNSVGA